MALFLIKDLDDDYHSRVGVWKIEESEQELRELCSIPSDELEEISYIKSESLRKQKLAVRALLDQMFEDKVYLNHHDNGKPYIENDATNISITHTDKFVAIILNDTEDVGIDCESPDRDFSAEQLAIYWCAKEAVYKLISQYGVDFAEQIEVQDFHPRGEGELTATFIHKDGYEEEFDLEYITFERHVLVWVVG